MKWLLKKIKTILLSRITKKQQTEWVEDRRKKCNSCPYNTLNIERKKLPLCVKIMMWLSDFYTFITLNEKTKLGTCTHPNCGCDIFYKTLEITEKCPKKKWLK